MFYISFLRCCLEGRGLACRLGLPVSTGTVRSSPDRALASSGVVVFWIFDLHPRGLTRIEVRRGRGSDRSPLQSMAASATNGDGSHLRNKIAEITTSRADGWVT